MKKSYLVVALSVLLGLISQESHAQRIVPRNGVELYKDIQKLGFLGNVLYVAAHPDDENTRLISYFANHIKAETAYISLTRGGGGQNLIGTEIGAKLGLIRTHELLGARAIDGGKQFFSRAIDFGYSKHSDETFAIWNKPQVTADLVKIIREFRPDIIINRFDHRSPGTTHGHHTGSAILSVEAFDLASDGQYKVLGLTNAEPWQTKRLFFNTSWWFYGSRENFEAADKSTLLAVDAGVHFYDSGYSNGEIAAFSRSMHKSQGFGSAGSRGSDLEYLEIIKGDFSEGSKDPFEGIDTRWSRVPNGTIVAQLIDELLSEYNFVETAKNIPKLIEIYKSIENTGDAFWKNKKLENLKEIIAHSAGLFLEVVASSKYGVPAQNLSLQVEAINRSTYPMILKNVRLNSSDQEISIEANLAPNIGLRQTIDWLIPADMRASNPYWLEEPGKLGLYQVPDNALIGNPISPSAEEVEFVIETGGVILSYSRDVIYKSTDPVAGETYLPFYIFPAASVQFIEPVYVFSDRNTRDVVVEVEAFRDNVSGQLLLEHQPSWLVTPSSIAFEGMQKGEKRLFTFQVKGPVLSESSVITAVVQTSTGEHLNRKLTQIVYDHIPNPIMLEPAEAKFERLNVSRNGERVAYLMGAGDVIPASLRQIGYQVDEILVDQLTENVLAQYDALIVGIRAYNTIESLKLKKEVILGYVASGGNYIVQYNTNRGVKGDEFSPYMLRLSNRRVTDEESMVSFELPEHDVLNTPNKITSRDFEGWVQERGLYFADQWGDEFEAPLAWADLGESLQKGSLLIAKHGNGHLIYTGISWFRQLPAGVPGAYRLFANMISLGKSTSTKNVNADNGGKR